MRREHRTTFFSGTLLDPQDFELEQDYDLGNDRTVELDIRSNGTVERWAEVEDLTASGPEDRHFVLDRSTGRVQFGDGLHGRVPEAGSHVEASYSYGSGRRGLLVAIPFATGIAGFLTARRRHRRA